MIFKETSGIIILCLMIGGCVFANAAGHRLSDVSIKIGSGMSVLAKGMDDGGLFDVSFAKGGLVGKAERAAFQPMDASSFSIVFAEAEMEGGGDWVGGEKIKAFHAYGSKAEMSFGISKDDQVFRLEASGLVVGVTNKWPMLSNAEISLAGGGETDSRRFTSSAFFVSPDSIAEIVESRHSAQGGSIFVFRNARTSFCTNSIPAGQDQDMAIGQAIDLWARMATNSSPKSSFEEIKLQESDFALFLLDSQLSSWKGPAFADFNGGNSLNSNLSTNLFFFALFGEPPHLECEEGPLRTFKKVEQAAGEENIYFNLVVEGHISGGTVDVDKFHVSFDPEFESVNCIRLSASVFPERQSYMMVVGCERKLHSISFSGQRLYLPPFDNRKCRASIHYGENEVGGFDFSLCEPLFFSVDIQIPN